MGLSQRPDFTSACRVSVAGLLLFASSLLAAPRTPLPPWPELTLTTYGWDTAEWRVPMSSPVPGEDSAVLAESWSGYALTRDALAVSPVVIPVVGGENKANVSSSSGAIRFWFCPSWSSTEAGGTGPGGYARLLELVNVGGKTSDVRWSLYLSEDGGAIYLSGLGKGGATDLLKVPVEFRVGEWRLVTLCYGPKETALFVDGEELARGDGVLSPGADEAKTLGLVVGSDLGTGNTAGGQFEELTTFDYWPSAEQQQFYFNGVSKQAALGPVSAEEEQAQLDAAAKWNQEQEGGGVQMLRLVGGTSQCITNARVYLTNISCMNIAGQGWTVTFDVQGGTNPAMLYDVFTTTNLLGNNITNSQWTWLERGPSCSTYQYTNQPVAAFYVLGLTNDTDADGLSDAYEKLVSKTLITTNDTDGDLMPDAWEVANGLNPVVNDASEDFDGDGASNYQEYTNSTNPHDQWIAVWGNCSNGQRATPAGIRDIIALDGGLQHTVALRSNRTVVAWGGNSYGQTNVPGGLSNVVGIAASWNQSMAVRANGTVTNWGQTYGTIPADLTNAVVVSVGWRHAMALRQNGTVTVWGDSSDPGSTNRSGLSSVKAIASGWEHNVALLSNGTVVVWGMNVLNITNVPPGLSNVIAIAAGGDHTLALRADGTVVAWGAGQTNNGFNWDRGQSMVPAGLSNVVAIAAGGYSSLALRADGTVVTWGELGSAPSGLSGVVAVGAGDGHCMAIRTGRQAPVILRQPENQVAALGSTVTLAVAATAPASLHYQWQFNGTNIAGATNATLTLTNVQATNEGSYRVLVSNGAGTTSSLEAMYNRLPPPIILSSTQPSELRLLYGDNVSLNVEATTPGAPSTPLNYYWTLNGKNWGTPYGTNLTTPLVSFFYSTLLSTYFEGVYSVVITNAGGGTNVSWTVYVAGEGSPIWWGNTTTQAWDTVLGVHDTLALAGGGNHNLLLHDNGTVLAWGTNDYGQTDVPVDLMNAPMNVGAAMAVAAGDAHSLALKPDGTVVAWGRNNFNQANVPVNVTNVIAISAGGHQSLALKKNGTVVQWGQTNAPVPTGLTNVSAVASGTNFHLALLKNSRVVAWGANQSGQTNVPANLSNVVAIAAGGAHALALKQNGTIVAWGANGSGQTNVPTTLTNAMAVAAGYSHSVALRNDGTVVAWGNNSYGQTNIPALTKVKLIAAGGYQSLASIFSPLVQYPVDVSKDLLLIYNTNSTNSIFVKDYYLGHRPMISGANVLGVGCTTNEVMANADFTNQIVTPMLNWLMANPTKHPQYIVLFLDVPSRLANFANIGSVSYALSERTSGIKPFITHIHMGDSNACKAYIDKLEFVGTNYSPGDIIISASLGEYGNTNYYFDDTQNCCVGTPGLSASNGVVQAGVSPASVTYTKIPDNGTLMGHITNGVNVAGYFCYGQHSSLGENYANDGKVVFSGNSTWYIIETFESYNGRRVIIQGNFIDWYSDNAFGGTNYSNTPVGAVTHVEEPGDIGVNDSAKYFGLWADGKNFAICAWNSRKTIIFQAVGDPLTAK